MTQVIASLAEIAADYDIVLCDIWGVLHDGQRVFPSAAAALQQFRADGGKVVLITNAPRPADAVAVQLDRLGAPRDSWDAIVTSGDAAQDAMLAGVVGQRVWHLGPDKDDAFFTDLPEGASTAIERVDLAEAEGIVATGLVDDMIEVPEDYRVVLTGAAARDLPMLCANPDIVVDFGDRRLYCAGALAALYEEMGGRTIYVGKPFAPIYDLSRRKIGATDASRILAIGDGIGTDVEGARRQGLDLLFVTGGLAHDQFGPDPRNPDPIAVAAWLRERQQAPRYAIGCLR